MPRAKKQPAQTSSGRLLLFANGMVVDHMRCPQKIAAMSHWRITGAIGVQQPNSTCLCRLKEEKSDAGGS